MKLARFQSASALLVGLVLLSTILTLFFISRDDAMIREKVTQSYYQNYLTEKVQLVQKLNIDKEAECATQQKEHIEINLNHLSYRFSCMNTTLFLRPKSTRDKYIQVDDIKQWLDLDTYQQAVHYIYSLADLPESSEQDPKIVVALKDIDETLTKNFYGIVATDFYFDIKGSKKIYGVLYSSFDNLREERNLTYRRAVVDNLEKRYSQWHYLPNSQTILSKE
ncbi:hypothetical protein A1D22_08435 [Pasteurellaceae bacterium LFhippo2]|nr:hypothetical protein [Pasteurellaceae bacterium LFhippo2]